MSFYIYKITNKINNKCYIGQSGKIRDRWVLHKRGARLVKNGATLSDNGIQVIHLALAKYGVDNFEFKVIEEADTQSEANERETYWVSYYDSFNSGYNCTLGGMNAPKTEKWKRKVKATRMANGGYGHSEKTKQRMSEEWHLYHSPESIEKTANANRGRKCSEEQKQWLSEFHKGNQYCLGHKQSKEVIEKRRKSYFERYGPVECNAPGCTRIDGWKVDSVRYCVLHAERLNRNGSLKLLPRPKPNLGKKHSEETKRKISESKKGKAVGKDNPFYGKKHSAETIKYLRDINIGKEPPNKIKFSDEDIERIMTDTRGMRKIAKDFGVSIRVIRRIKKENGANY